MQELPLNHPGPSNGFPPGPLLFASYLCGRRWFRTTEPPFVRPDEEGGMNRIDDLAMSSRYFFGWRGVVLGGFLAAAGRLFCLTRDGADIIVGSIQENLESRVLPSDTIIA